MCRSIRSSILPICWKSSKTMKNSNGTCLIAWQREGRLTAPTFSLCSTHLNQRSFSRSSRMPRFRGMSRKTRNRRWRRSKCLSLGMSNWKRFHSNQVSNLLFLILVEERGRTIFLLKQKAKASQAQKKRRKVSLLKLKTGGGMQVDTAEHKATPDNPKGTKKIEP